MELRGTRGFAGGREAGYEDELEDRKAVRGAMKVWDELTVDLPA